MKIVLAIAAVVILSTIGSSATIHVPDDFGTIQEAIDASVNGDVVIVRPGTYNENVDFRGRAIHVRSERGSAATVIDGGQLRSVVTFENDEGPDSVLDGFMITNGIGNSTGTSYRFGGGIYCFFTSPTITNNIIEYNKCNAKGCGIYCMYQAHADIRNNIIRDNTMSRGLRYVEGGGVYCGESSRPNISHNIIVRNYADRGGGIYCSSSHPDVTDNVIADNAVELHGGGIGFKESLADVIGNVIQDNISIDNEGAGIHSKQSLLIVTNNAICGNRSEGYRGGGLFFLNTKATLTNNSISGNTATRNGGGIYAISGSLVTITNTLFWDNYAPVGEEIYVGNMYAGDGMTPESSSSLSIASSDVMGGQARVYVESGCTLDWGSGMIDADPIFADVTSGDYHLTWHSPCRDAGENGSVIEAGDFEGDPRIALGSVDIGADEFYPHLYHAGNPSPGAEVTFRAIGFPKSGCSLILGSGLCDPPLPTPFGELRLDFPLTLFNTGNFPGTGFKSHRYVLPSCLEPGDRLYCQLLTSGMFTNLMVLRVE